MKKKMTIKKQVIGNDVVIALSISVLLHFYGSFMFANLFVISFSLCFFLSLFFALFSYAILKSVAVFFSLSLD